MVVEIGFWKRDYEQERSWTLVHRNRNKHYHCKQMTDINVKNGITTLSGMMNGYQTISIVSMCPFICQAQRHICSEGLGISLCRFP